MTRSKFDALAQGAALDVKEEVPQQVLPAPERPVDIPPPPVAEDLRTLGARVPDGIFREFSRRKSEAEDELGLRKVTTEAGLEALVRALRHPAVRQAWHGELEGLVPKRRTR
ncbi:hypothetical protein K7W42_20415 [Deinococcus sp. HMF7604]|uniref:hypothetical protein n=1 Tax=Deinococcus betulae TaxID=2873312 RepID=UPI001CCE3AC3|nr:hypothetical protein [Deinococcus betulae]MBZ9753204.1 hypothetical protein [Deinococcus betulae]